MRQALFVKCAKTYLTRSWWRGITDQQQLREYAGQLFHVNVSEWRVLAKAG
jgi:hypothetical protein